MKNLNILLTKIKDLIDGVQSEAAQKQAKKAGRLHDQGADEDLLRATVENMSEKQLAKEMQKLEKQMLQHAQNLEFEKAARVRDQLAQLRNRAFFPK